MSSITAAVRAPQEEDLPAAGPPGRLLLAQHLQGHDGEVDAFAEVFEAPTLKLIVFSSAKKGCVYERTPDGTLLVDMRIVVGVGTERQWRSPPEKLRSLFHQLLAGPLRGSILDGLLVINELKEDEDGIVFGLVLEVAQRWAHPDRRKRMYEAISQRSAPRN
ncbi:hypothetical protein AAVH_35773, partial [Aphelenchoides avenae]